MWAVAEGGDVPQGEWRWGLCKVCNLSESLHLRLELTSSELILDDLRFFISSAVRSQRESLWSVQGQICIFEGPVHILVGRPFYKKNINTQFYVGYKALEWAIVIKGP